MNSQAMTTAVGITLMLILVVFMWNLLAPTPKKGSRREKITLREFCHELMDEDLRRWQWWVLLCLLIWKL